MLENVAKITLVVLACRTVDLRKGIDGLFYDYRKRKIIRRIATS